jgi:hypothetical protein
MKKVFTISVVIFWAIIFFLPKNALALTTNINLNSASPGLQSQTFNVPAGFTSVKIISGAIDDRGQVSINGSQVLFGCSSHLACSDAGSYWVLDSNPCNPANAITPPHDMWNLVGLNVDITPFAVVGVNTLTVNVDNCAGGPSGFNFNIEIVYTNIPACSSFTASPASINIGDSSTLSWTVTNTNPMGVTINPGGIIGAAPAGSVSVSPATATTYTMDLTGPGGNTLNACSTAVSFNVPSCTIAAADAGVYSGDTTAISWTTTNAASATLNGASVLVNGSQTTPPITGSTAFNLIATGPGGNVTCSTTVGLLTPPTGGLVPCGRLADDTATTEINESKPCDLCAAMYMLKRMLNFIMELATGIAIFIIVLGGLLYAFSAGNPGKIEKAKSTVTGAIIGLAIMFAAWLIVAIILNAMGYADITNWNQVNCALQT